MADPTTIVLNGATVVVADMLYGLSFDPGKKSFGLWSKAKGAEGDWKKEQDISAATLGEVANQGISAKKEVVVQLSPNEPIHINLATSLHLPAAAPVQINAASSIATRFRIK